MWKSEMARVFGNDFDCFSEVMIDYFIKLEDYAALLV